MPDESVIDSEIVAMDDDGRPSFNLLQNYGSSKTPLIYYAFDVMVLAGEDVMGESLETRRRLLEDRVLSKLDEPIRFSPGLDAKLPARIQSVKAQGFDGLVAKNRKSRYEPGQRSGALAEDAGKPGTGAGDRRVYALAEEFRRAGDRVLR